METDSRKDHKYEQGILIGNIFTTKEQLEINRQKVLDFGPANVTTVSLHPDGTLSINGRSEW